VAHGCVAYGSCKKMLSYHSRLSPSVCAFSARCPALGMKCPPGNLFQGRVTCICLVVIYPTSVLLIVLMLSSYKLEVKWFWDVKYQLCVFVFYFFCLCLSQSFVSTVHHLDNFLEVRLLIVLILFKPFIVISDGELFTSHYLVNTVFFVCEINGRKTFCIVPYLYCHRLFVPVILSLQNAVNSRSLMSSTRSHCSAVSFMHCIKMLNGQHCNL